ncbi:MAG: tetratricopeptide repeat protein [Betaproteobacteria bacterium]|nr:tetratricopeptide repeat protein [Betaproteobacteria bacterium]
MSLLLQALQKAAKSREEGEVDLSVDALAMADELALEPTLSAPRTHQDSPESPTSAQAATVVQAGSVPAFDALDYAREHYMLSLISIAILLAAGYGTYVYLQVSQPFRHSTPAPSPLAAPTAQAPPVNAPPLSANAKISGMPGSTTTPVTSAGASAAAMATERAAAAPDQRTPPASPSILDEPAAKAAVARESTATKPFPGAATKLRRRPESAPLADASDSIETVVIPTLQSKPSGDISVRRDAASVAPISPTLMKAYEALQSGDHARAKGLYEQVLQAEPRNIDALLGLGVIALNEGHIDDASRYYQRVLELDPRNSYAQAGLISIVGGADLQASEFRLKQLIARDPSAFLYFSLGNLYAEQGQWPSAQQTYFQAYQMQQDNPDYAFNLAIGLEHLGQNRLALDYYRKALDLSFKKGHANFDQSLVIQRVGQLSTRVEQ